MTPSTGEVGVRAHPPPTVEEEEGEEGAGGHHHDDDDGQGSHIYGNQMTGGDFIRYFNVFHINGWNTD